MAYATSVGFQDYNQAQQQDPAWAKAHSQNIAQAYQQQFGVAPTPGQLNSWASLSGDMNTISGLMNQGFRDATQTPLAQQNALSQAQGAYQPLTDAQNKLTQNQFDTLKQQIGVQGDQAKAGVATTLAGRGFGRDSGELGWDTAQIDQQTQQSLNTANIQQTVQQAQQNLQNWQQVTGAASQLQQQEFSQSLQTQAQDFSQWLQQQGVDASLFTSLPQAYSTLLNMGTAPTQQMYDQLMALEQKMTAGPGGQ